MAIVPDGAAIGIGRHFSVEGVHPYDQVAWDLRDARITNFVDGAVAFEQLGVEVPASWSVNATNILAQKYFRGTPGTPDRESSLRQVVDRVVDTITAWGEGDGYFADAAEAHAFSGELKWLIVNQHAAFNSPVWFNIGVQGVPAQSSACFILAVEDNMASILRWYTEEGLIFKGGSGAGINLSPIRSAQEGMTGGGQPSGPVSFMRGADASAGTIRSGGKTRRAAKMVILNADHPDIEDFIWCKVLEERKARVLRDAGFDMGIDGSDIHSVQYQNGNNSVRVTDAFMRAVADDTGWDLRAVTTGEVLRTVRARGLWRQIAQASWECADPGLQFDTTINRWHTCPTSGRINGSNPCSEYMHLDNSACNLASLNLLRFLSEDGFFDVDGFKFAVSVLLTAQEILVGNADYPTAKIGENARRFRQLGIGYANLGALLMALGLPYDSDEGRALAATITALMTGQAYATSARTAARMGPFGGFEDNREATLEVLRMHRTEVAKIDDKLVPSGLMSAARASWDAAVALAEHHGVRNSQASVLAPTGCLVGGSLVPTERGLVRLSSLGDPEGTRWQDLGLRVGTDAGSAQATRFFVNGLSRVVTVETRRGYRIQGTPQHRVKVVDWATGEWSWRCLSDMRPGDAVPLALDQLVGEPNAVSLPPLGEAYSTGEHHAAAPEAMTEELAELIGYFMGDGSLHSRGIRLCVTDGDFDVVERLCQLGKECFDLTAHVMPQQGYTEVRLDSARLTLWWQACGLAKHPPVRGHTEKGYVPHIPDAVLGTNDGLVYKAFLSGLFEADGTVTNGYPCWSTTSLDFSRDVQSVLLSLGYPTTRKVDTRLAILRLLNLGANQRWLEDIGFIGARKNASVAATATTQAGKHDYIPLTRQMIERLAPANDEVRRVAVMEVARGTVSRRVATDLYRRTGDPELGHLLSFFYDRVTAADLGAEELTYDLSVPENVTYIANGFVSHNTISFLMDCDTTGIEPDLSLVKTKRLVGGGTMSIVNQTVPRALRRLGYDNDQIAGIVAYVDAHSSIVGAPGLRPEHLAVFACSMGDNTIHHMGHIRMMAAAQPFISGAISKTANVPEHVTVEDIEQIHFDSWRFGLKSVAIYRDNSKVAQPLATAKMPTAPRPTRERLPRRRRSSTFKFQVADCEGYVTVGEYDDGRPGEVFMKVSKQGSTLAGIMDAFSVAISIGLQHGVPLATFVSKYINMRFEPAGLTDDPEIRLATSLLDYIFRRLAVDYLQPDERVGLGIQTTGERSQPTLPGLEVAGSSSSAVVETPLSESDRIGAGRATFGVPPGKEAKDAPYCYQCGNAMQRAGSCYVCVTCGTTSGCS